MKAVGVVLSVFSIQAQCVEGPQRWMIDLLTAMRHLADREGLAWVEVLANSSVHIMGEVIEGLRDLAAHVGANWQQILAESAHNRQAERIAEGQAPDDLSRTLDLSWDEYVDVEKFRRALNAAIQQCTPHASATARVCLDALEEQFGDDDVANCNELTQQIGLYIMDTITFDEPDGKSQSINGAGTIQSSTITKSNGNCRTE
jgi:hypothetical protein